MVVPLVVDIHVAGELECGAVFQCCQVLQRVEFSDVGVDGVFGVRADRALAVGGYHKACHLGILAAHMRQRHRCGAARPGAHSAVNTVIAHVGNQVKVVGVGAIDGDARDAALGNLQGNGAVDIDAQRVAALRVPDACLGSAVGRR